MHGEIQHLLDTKNAGGLTMCFYLFCSKYIKLIFYILLRGQNGSHLNFVLLAVYCKDYNNKGNKMYPNTFLYSLTLHPER